MSESSKHNSLQRAMDIMGPIVFLLWMGLFLFHSRSLDRLDTPPAGEHFWASTDRASLARTYSQDENSFWEPHVHLTNGRREGITAGELPLIPWLASRLHIANGFHEYHFRGLVLLLSLLGFLVGYLLARRLVSHPLVAAIAASMWVISANLMYYGNSHLSDVPAMGMIAMGLWLLLRRKEGPNAAAWIGFSVFLALGGLLKLSAMFPAFAILGAWLLTDGRKQLGTRKAFLMALVSVAVPIAVVYAWVRYARHLTEENGVFVFLLEPLPPKSFDEMMAGLRELFSLSSYYMAPMMWSLLGLGTIAGLVFLKRSNKFLLLAAVFTYLSYFFFFLLMFEKAPTHHYYTIPFQLGLLFHFLWLADLVARVKLPVWAGAIVVTIFMLLLNTATVQQSKVVKARYTHYPGIFEEYHDVEPTLQMLGVTYQHRVLSYDDFTYNGSLYLMNRKGMPLNHQSPPEHVERAIKSSDFAIINTQFNLAETGLAQHLGPPIGYHRTLSIHPVIKYPTSPVPHDQ